MSPTKCRWCGNELTPGSATCPRCRRATEEELRPLGGEAAPRVPARETSPPPPSSPKAREFRPEGEPRSVGARPAGERQGYWAALRELVKSDPLFAVVIALIGAGAVYLFVTGHPFAGTIVCLVFWGLLTLNYWVYILMVVLSGYGVLLSARTLLALATSGAFGPFDLFVELTALAWMVFFLVVLLGRSRYYRHHM